MGICEENMAKWGIPKKRTKKQLGDVDLRSIGYSIALLVKREMDKKGAKNWQE